MNLRVPMVSIPTDNMEFSRMHPQAGNERERELLK